MMLRLAPRSCFFPFVGATPKGSEWDSCSWEGDMKALIRSKIGALALGDALALAISATPKQAGQPSAHHLPLQNLTPESFLLAPLVKSTPPPTPLPLASH